MKIILRSEYKQSERRSPLIPKHAAQLVQNGYDVYVEESPRRLFSMEDYIAAGCNSLPEYAWENEPADPNTIILGLKELPHHLEKIHGKHIYFAHIYKGQDDSDKSFKQLETGNGLLYDLEFLQNEQGRRVAAFGYWAGYVGAALALWQYGLKENGKNLNDLKTFDSQDDLIRNVAEAVTETNKLRSIIVGASGRCGTGAQDFFKTQGVQITGWDAQETKPGGPFKEIIEHDIFINCVYLSKEIPPFIDQKTIEAESSKLKVISDVSCDPNGPWNPIRVYNQHTTWENPALALSHCDTDVIAIDNLPSLLPKESSEDFSEQLIPYLLDLKEDQLGVWKRAENIFYENKKEYS
jgi:saccharopine dehydrogenase (NAD+, L-lysine-forming)